ncbi:protein translocase subunit SecB [Neokomagataea thailandica NBRC 106555]|uniref:Preprotein translocase subunit SecB n=2 Tax=Neokomagataea TaxID=1223423 RepID=A0A4Y6V8A3_9PROT|nr:MULTISPECIES: protein-export chaperone SecB [Neokomagataea]QDH25574.1 preprotein translocase subunit SecB [Neokomagataea tanensis]GBR52655.1 protein translocase subunit SecB [Neokomagataea thailandica NBRC 106555]
MNDHAYSDTLSGAQQGPATASKKATLVIGTQYLQRLNIEIQNTPLVFQDLPPQLHLGLIVDVTARQVADAQNGFEVSLVIRAQGMKSAPSESVPNPEVVYDISMSYAGLFGFNASVERAQAEEALLVDAPHHLFPAARSMLLNTIREAGFPTINLQPIDFDVLWKSRRS